MTYSGFNRTTSSAVGASMYKLSTNPPLSAAEMISAFSLPTATISLLGIFFMTDSGAAITLASILGSRTSPSRLRK